MIRRIKSENAPKPAGCYSQATRVGNLIFTAGQLPVDPTTGKALKGASPAEQTRRILKNIAALLEENGSSLEKVAKATVLIRDVTLWDEVNKAYSEFFTGPVPPARTVASGIDIHNGLDVEIDVIAEVGDS
ncbi:MAG: Rid family detoxifying hydrolase [Synergistota bacterium]|nr:Rid family detoxifying hydrolase [Synergistota bacterium]